jgi:acyl-CoA reductase-like NAD-dependent aldehyde dehydrogenase
MMSNMVRIISPVDGSVYAERPVAAEADVARAVAAAKTAQRAWSAESIATRSRMVTAFVDALLAMKDDMTTELAWQMGRPVRWGGETKGIEERSRHMIAIAERSLAPIELSDRPGFRRAIKREPLGCMLVIAPWNYPFLTAVNSVVPGLVAGNAVLLKHASQTLLAGERFQQAADRAGLPKGLFQNLVMDHGQTERLIASDAIDHVNFTGSVEGGRKIERAAAGTFASLGLELGGKDPAYVLPDAPFDLTIECLVDGAYFNSGQCCCGIERIYVHADAYDRFVDAFVAAAETYRLGNPFDDASIIGPMARAHYADLVRDQTDEAVAKGGRTLLPSGGHPLDRRGSPYLAPQALVDVDHGMSLMTLENFGPVVGIMKVGDDDEAIRLMNDSVYGLTASIWSADADRAASIGDRIETGTVFLNRCDYLDPGLVWTGVKDTGKGGALSELGYHYLTRPKSYHFRLA